KEARGRETRLARLERIEAPREHQILKVRLQTAARSGRAVLTTTPLVIGYPPENGSSDPDILATAPEMEVERGDRVAVIGPNGAGKTTLVRTIIGELPPLKGRLQFGVNVKPAYYAQGHEQLDPDETVLSTLLKQRAWGEEAARTVAGRYLFSGDDVYKPVEALSGGERSRLALALLALEEANFLILDEPTNHLDISSRESLEVVLSEFDGTILFVSHDRYLIDRLATDLWVLEDETITPRLGNYTDYLRSRSGEPEAKGKAGQAAKKAASSSKTPEPVPPNGNRANGRRSDRELRKLRQELSAAERSIGKLEQRLNEISDDLAVANVDQNIEAIARLGRDYDDVQQRLEESYRAWETLSSLIYEADAAADVSQQVGAQKGD
ncbi:MAG TPA: ATP-binding cassette domain-containing protein, partial [Thermomicrobiaceae bacterium]|nr:ATP-binding cassette domain-containing protein [Thermomicrobiaceae bacterium]